MVISIKQVNIPAFNHLYTPKISLNISKLHTNCKLQRNTFFLVPQNDDFIQNHSTYVLCFSEAINTCYPLNSKY